MCILCDGGWAALHGPSPLHIRAMIFGVMFVLWLFLFFFFTSHSAAQAFFFFFFVSLGPREFHVSGAIYISNEFHRPVNFTHKFQFLKVRQGSNVPKFNCNGNALLVFSIVVAHTLAHTQMHSQRHSPLADDPGTRRPTVSGHSFVQTFKSQSYIYYKLISCSFR